MQTRIHTHISAYIHMPSIHRKYHSHVYTYTDAYTYAYIHTHITVHVCTFAFCMACWNTPGRAGSGAGPWGGLAARPLRGAFGGARAKPRVHTGFEYRE